MEKFCSFLSRASVPVSQWVSADASALRIFIALAASRQLEELFVAAACWSPGTAAPDCAGACFEVASLPDSIPEAARKAAWAGVLTVVSTSKLYSSKKLCRAMASRIGIPRAGLARPAMSS